MQQGACFLLMSRAAVVDFPAFLDAVRSGHIRAATDVFPVEPVAKDDPVRQVEGLLLSAHRTGGMRRRSSSFRRVLNMRFPEVRACRTSTYTRLHARSSWLETLEPARLVCTPWRKVPL
jgi:phosphoglycerate dehydrogenase-like enzyme